jgi:hypothetical protein
MFCCAAPEKDSINVTIIRLIFILILTLDNLNLFASQMTSS